MPTYMGDDGILPEQRKIYEACLQGSLKEIKEAIGKDGVSQIVKDGLLPIHVAACSAREDLEEVIVFLLECGSDINAQTESDLDTILHLIPRHNTIRIAFPTILKILEFNPDVYIRNRRLRSPYDEAIALGYFELANVLDGTRDAKEARSYYDEGIGNMYGAKLVDAVMNSNEKAAKDYITNGANCNFVNQHGAGAIHYLFSHYEHPPENILPELLKAKADPNLRDYEGDNSLNLAIKSQRLHDSGTMYKIVSQLLEKGAHSTIKDLDGNDALAIATRREYKDIVKLIRKFRAGHLSDEMEDPKPPENDTEKEIEPIKRTPTATFDEESEEDEDDILDDPDLDVNQPNHLGLYPLHQAILRTDPVERNRLVNKILNRGADISARAQTSDEHDESGNTALHMAVSRDQLGTVKLLLQHRPVYNVPNNEGLTEVEIAEKRQNEEMIKVLKDYEKTVQSEKEQSDPRKKKNSTCVIL